MKLFLQNNDIEMYLTHNERKSISAERFIRILKNKICKYMSSVSKNVYIDKLDYIVNKYNNTYHREIQIKLVDVKSSTYIIFSKENNDEDPKFKIVDIVRISKYKNIFVKAHILNWSAEDFMIIKVKNIVPWTYLINDLKNMINPYNCFLKAYIPTGLGKIL